jgi:hypothetical protein
MFPLMCVCVERMVQQWVHWWHVGKSPKEANARVEYVEKMLTLTISGCSCVCVCTGGSNYMWRKRELSTCKQYLNMSLPAISAGP